MDKRKYQRVVLISGLLFLTIIIIGFIFNHTLKQIQIEKYGVIGQLMTNHPEMELELIQAFERSKQSDNDIQVGRVLEEKYGYTDVRTNSIQYIRNFMLYIILFLLTIMVLIATILIYFEHKQNKHESEQERTKEHLKELEERNQVLLEKLTLEEKATKTLVTDISHQLKTPLASLKMSYEIAQMDNFTEDERKGFLIKGWEEIKKLESLLEALLNLTRLEANMIQPIIIHWYRQFFLY